MSAATRADENAFSTDHGIGEIEITDYSLPDPCDSELRELEDSPPGEANSMQQTGTFAGTAQLAVQTCELTEADENKTGLSSEDQGSTLVN